MSAEKVLRKSAARWACEAVHGIVDIINRYAIYISCVSFDANLIHEAFPRSIARCAVDGHGLKGAFRTPYGALLHLCMWGLGDLVSKKRPNEGRQISYVLEAGDEGQPGFLHYLDSLMAGAGGHPIYKTVLDSYSIHGVTPMPKDRIQDVLHSADLIAWEWARQVDRQRNSRPMRGSLSAITEGGNSNPDHFGLTLSNDRMFFRHYDARHANRMARFFRTALEADTHEEVDRALSQWEATRFEESV